MPTISMACPFKCGFLSKNCSLQMTTAAAPSLVGEHLLLEYSIFFCPFPQFITPIIPYNRIFFVHSPLHPVKIPSGIDFLDCSPNVNDSSMQFLQNVPVSFLRPIFLNFIPPIPTIFFHMFSAGIAEHLRSYWGCLQSISVRHQLKTLILPFIPKFCSFSLQYVCPPAKHDRPNVRGNSPNFLVASENDGIELREMNLFWGTFSKPTANIKSTFPLSIICLQRKMPLDPLAHALFNYTKYKIFNSNLSFAF